MPTRYNKAGGQKAAKQAIKDLKGMGSMVKKGATNYGKNVAGGAKIVGSAVKRKVFKAFQR